MPPGAPPTGAPRVRGPMGRSLRDVDPAAMARALSGGAAADAAPLANLTFRMSPPEASRWYGLLLLAASYLEWGSGGSTVVAAWRSRSAPLAVHSVDNSRAWLDRLRAAHPVLGRAESAGAVTLSWADTGPTTRWGHPADWRRRNESLRLRQATAYVEAVNASGCCFDLILVDGRFRSACLLHALRLSHPQTTVLVHDAQRYLGSSDGASAGVGAVRGPARASPRPPPTAGPPPLPLAALPAAGRARVALHAAAAGPGHRPGQGRRPRFRTAVRQAPAGRALSRGAGRARDVSGAARVRFDSPGFTVQSRGHSTPRAAEPRSASSAPPHPPPRHTVRSPAQASAPSHSSLHSTTRTAPSD
eukprot:scaffold4055_cov132-Isochrysis_galbana.AAC.5